MTAPGTSETKRVLSWAADWSVTNGLLDAREVSSTEKEGQCAKVRTLSTRISIRLVIGIITGQIARN